MGGPGHRLHSGPVVRSTRGRDPGQRVDVWSAGERATLSSGWTDLAERGNGRGECGQRFHGPRTGLADDHVLDAERRCARAPADELVAGLTGFQPGAQRLLDRLV